MVLIVDSLTTLREDKTLEAVITTSVVKKEEWMPIDGKITKINNSNLKPNDSREELQDMEVDSIITTTTVSRVEEEAFTINMVGIKAEEVANKGLLTTTISNMVNKVSKIKEDITINKVALINNREDLINRENPNFLSPTSMI